MDFFTNVGKTLTETSQGAVQKTKEMAESVRLSAVISEENKKITALQQEIGFLVSDSFQSLDKGELVACLNERARQKGQKASGAETVSRESEKSDWPEMAVQTEEAIRANTDEKSLSADTSGTEMRIRKILEENEDVLRHIVQIKVCQEAIAACQAQISAIKGMKKCPYCKGDVPQNAAFCGSCGKKVTEEEYKEEQDIRFCTSCGAKIEPDFAFCVNCGQKLD